MDITSAVSGESVVPGARSRKAQLAVGLLISATTLLLLLGGLELAGYLWERRTAQGLLGWTLVASRRLHLERHGSADRPYHLFRPNEDYLWEGIPVHINSRGFRTEEFDVPKPAGTYRILNVGDSVAFGWEVRQEDTYGVQLERMLNARASEHHYEVINAGIPAWTLESERNFLLQEGLDYQPDMVILDVTVVNDIYGRGPAVSEQQTVFHWLRDHTYFWPFLTTQRRFLLAKQRGMAQACRQRDVRFVVVAFPTAFQLNSAGHPDVPQQVLRQRAAEAGIEFVDLLPVYRRACDDASPGACEGYESLLFADVWMHPNQLGHRLAAEMLSAKWK